METPQKDKMTSSHLIIGASSRKLLKSLILSKLFFPLEHALLYSHRSFSTPKWKPDTTKLDINAKNNNLRTIESFIGITK